jgi:hypothetical protein
MKFETLFASLVIGACLVGCSPSAPAPPARAGQIKITGVGPMRFQNGETALVMNYETGISMTNMPALRKEVDGLWARFEKDVESARLTNAIIRAVHTEGGGLITHSRGYGFVFVKRSDGLWHCLQDEKP